MLDEPRSERVAMVWPKSLKEKVREVAGPGGMTDFVIDAVVAHLSGQGVPVPASAEEEKILKEAAASPTVVKAREPIETHKREVWKEPAGPAEGKATNLTLEEPIEPPVDLRGRDDLFARVMSKAGNADELAAHKGEFKTASDLLPTLHPDEISKLASPPPVAPDWIGDPDLSKEEKLAHFEELKPQPTTGPKLCKLCGEGLVDGECWSCD